MTDDFGAGTGDAKAGRPLNDQECSATEPPGSGESLPSTARSTGARLGPMTEIPDEGTTRRDEDEAARDSLAGDIAKEIDPDVDELDDGKRGITPDAGD